MGEPTMHVLTFDHHAFNYLYGAQGDYFVLHAPTGEPLVLPNRCPHRGGPLHLAAFAGEEAKLVCPWHGNGLGAGALRRLALPSVARAHHLTVVVDEAAGALTLGRRMVLAHGSYSPSTCASAPPAAP